MRLVRFLQNLHRGLTWQRAWLLSPYQPYQVSPRVVCLCGSTRFVETFHIANRQESLKGNIVLTIATARIEDKIVDPVKKAVVDELHLRKIELADEVLVLDVGGYLGPSTQREVAYAKALGKPLRFWEGGTYPP